jgi:death-on-curing protein
MGVIFLSLDEVLAIHADQIATFGGSAGVRDLGLLESALAVPQAAFGGAYLHQDLYEMAAAYLFHLVSNHPFLDGNKRTGSLAAVVFLEINGIDVNVPEQQFQDLVLAVASGRAGKQEIVGFFRRHLPPPPSV